MRKKSNQKVSKKNPFLNKKVIVTLSITMKKSEMSDMGETSIIRPIAMPGYLLAEDSEKLYLGDTEEFVSFYIPKSNIGFVELFPELPDKYDTIMDKDDSYSKFDN